MMSRQIIVEELLGFDLAMLPTLNRVPPPQTVRGRTAALFNRNGRDPQGAK
jgi:hypothetical protein